MGTARNPQDCSGCDAVCDKRQQFQRGLRRLARSAWRPEAHGVTANFFFDEATGKELYMESSDLVLRPTLFERAASAGVASALLSAKKKTITLLPRGASVVLAAETPTEEWVSRL